MEIYKRPSIAGSTRVEIHRMTWFWTRIMLNLEVGTGRGY
jgi:hypothetical protein